jgi:hypothetical protein
MMGTLQQRMMSYLGGYFPRWVWRQYGRKAERLGLEGIHLILSFDCDTPEDIDAAGDLDDFLCQQGIKRTYAVPGPLLEQGADIFRPLAEKGADFINHGAMPHTEWRGKRYWSVNFYHDLSSEEVLEDIRLGHKMVERVTGRAPRGFRAPHFGQFQATGQLDLLHNTLNKLNYRYSTSTVPKFGFQHGPVWKEGRLYEIPSSGSYRSFFTLFDSWNYVISPEQPVVGEGFGEIFVETMTQLVTMGVSGVLNYYLDPSHISKSESFFGAIDYVVRHRIPTLQFEELLDLVEGKKAGHKTSFRRSQD